MLVDIHVHTRLSSDSNVSAEQYLQAVARSGQPLGAICFTEHRLFPVDPALDREYAELSQRYGVRIFKGVEADTDFGHLILLGVSAALMRHFDLTDRMLKSEQLIAAVHAEGGIAIPAHPFRDSDFGARIPDLVGRLNGSMTALEGINGQNSPEQNDRALKAALTHGLIALGGSDAHFATPKWFLTTATRLEREVVSVEELCQELRAGRARAIDL